MISLNSRFLEMKSCFPALLIKPLDILGEDFDFVTVLYGSF